MAAARMIGVFAALIVALLIGRMLGMSDRHVVCPPTVEMLA